MEIEKSYLLNLEEELDRDVTGAFRKDISDRLAQRIAEMKSELNRGLAVEEFERLNKVKNALEAASEVVSKVWAQMHV